MNYDTPPLKAQLYQQQNKKLLGVVSSNILQQSTNEVINNTLTTVFSNSQQITNCEKMDLDDMRKRFEEGIGTLMRNKRTYLNLAEYNNLINYVKESKINLQTGKKKTFKDNRLVRKYDVLTINGQEKLIKPVPQDSQNVLFYATNEELFDIIHTTHSSIGHGGRNRTISELKRRYCNITKESVMLYLRLCPHCKKKLKRDTKPILHSDFNFRAQIELIDMQAQNYKDYCFIMVHQDHLTKFTILKPLKSKHAKEIALNLIEIYNTFGMPTILHSNNGREFVNSVLIELYALWDGIKIIHGKPQHSYSQDDVEVLNWDVKRRLSAWMEENKSVDWPMGLKFVQFQKNRALHSDIGRPPYEAMFGCPAQIGLSSIGIQSDEIINVNEEDIEVMVYDERLKPDDSEREIDAVNKSGRMSKLFTSESDNNFSVVSARLDKIQHERKRSLKCLKNQATKMTELSTDDISDIELAMMMEPEILFEMY